MKINHKIILTAIVLLFLFTRLYKITEIPSSLYWDEASIGYNAYSVLKTGRDEWGEFLPIHFRAFGEFKLPVFVYAVALSEYIFGLNEFAVRFPAVVFSLGVLILVYLLSVKLFDNKVIGLYSAFFLTITPWFFIISRTGYEATAGLFFFLLGIYLFLTGIHKNIYLYLSCGSFILSLYSYNSFRIITPLTLIFLIFYLVNNWTGNIKKLIAILTANAFFLAVFILPIVNLLNSVDGNTRLNTVGIFSRAIDNQDLVKSFIENYFSHFSPEYLFINGDSNLRSGLGIYGVLYWTQLPLLLMAVIYILKSKSKLLYFLLLLILISPIPAAITVESPHLLRAISALPFIAMLSGYGLYLIIGKLKKVNIFHYLAIGIFLVFFGYFFLIFLNSYPEKSAFYWQYGYKKIFTEYKSEFARYDQVLVSDYMAQPYIFYLFYTSFDPNLQIKQKEVNTIDKWGFSVVSKYGNIVFTPIDGNILPIGKSLVFTSPVEKLDGMVKKGSIKNLKGDVDFYVYEFEKQ